MLTGERWRMGKTLTGIMFVLPAALVVLGVIGYALVDAGWLSLTDKLVGSQAHFVGLQNYRELILDSAYRKTLRNTFIYTVGGVAAKTVLGMVMALTLSRNMRGRDALGGLLLLPWILPTAISTLIWMWMLDDSTGILNFMLVKTGLVSHNIAWLATPALAMTSVILVGVWREVPYFGLSLLAALKTVPQDQYEAAGIDGANAVRQFWHVTLPNIRGVLALTAMLSAIQSAYEFSTVYILTRGGPTGSTHLFSTMTYDMAFAVGKMGKAVAVSLLAFPIFGSLMFLVTRVVEKQEA